MVRGPISQLLCFVEVASTITASGIALHFSQPHFHFPSVYMPCFCASQIKLHHSKFFSETLFSREPGLRQLPQNQYFCHP